MNTIRGLELLLATSKGGNVPGITEDHRYEMMERLKLLRQSDLTVDTGREIIANTAITLVTILILAGIGFWVAS